MTFIALTDIHGSASHVSKIKEELGAADWIFLGGDITHFGGAAEAAAVIDQIKLVNENIFSVAGNCDRPDVEKFLVKENLGGHGRTIRIGDLTVSGVGGSLPAPVFTPYTFSEKEYTSLFTEMESASGSAPDIVVSHQPPWGTELDKVWGTRHVGSKSLRKFIERTSPLLVICGHIHESSGTDKIGDTMLVNPGPFRHGSYARILLDANGVETELLP